MKKVKFCFGIHNHQPVGNFGWVIEEAYQKSYLPFLVLLEKYPLFRISLHFTGILYDWIRQYHPECFKLIKTLVDRGQVELLTGGHFEPIMPIIPERDRIAQIKMESEFIKANFGVQPEGMWLAERVWEPMLPKTLNQAGVKYTILDDIHFRYAGLTEEQLHGYYRTEDEGFGLSLFPISKKLRYAIPFADPEVTIEYLRSISSESGAAVGIYADDGEKFGVWPDTYEHCFTNGWLERFFKLITANLDWIEMRTFVEVLHEVKPLGIVYLPTASYSEMNEWAMPVDAIERYDDFVHQLNTEKLYDQNTSFVKGGFWRNFLSKYSESNNIHKRMLYVSNLLETYRSKLPAKVVTTAERHLFGGQCNCPYWHGVFGGLYLPHLRGAVYQELVAAEKTILHALPKSQALEPVQTIDFDGDGNDEIIVTAKMQKAFISPALGGAIFELDDFAITKNLTDIVGRRKEGYHKKLLSRHENTGEVTKSIHDRVMVKEEGLEKLLVEDTYRRGLFIDHFFGESTTLHEFETSTHEELGDFVSQQYESSQKTTKNAIEVSLTRHGHVKHEGSLCPISLAKTLRLSTSDGSLSARYEITNHHSHSLSLRFGVECGLASFVFPMSESSISSGEALLKSDSEVSLKSASSVTLHSRLYKYLLTLTIDKPTDWWLHPLWTVSLSEGGFEKVYQGAIIVPHWHITVNSGESWKAEISLNGRVLADHEQQSDFRRSEAVASDVHGE